MTAKSDAQAAWVILSRRYGGDTRSPTPTDLAAAVAELFHEDLPGMTEADYREHGDASLRRGHDDGPMYVLGVDRVGVASFEEWADQDYDTELAPRRELRGVTEQLAVQLWTWLAAGDVARVRALFASE